MGYGISSLVVKKSDFVLNINTFLFKNKKYLSLWGLGLKENYILQTNTMSSQQKRALFQKTKVF